MILRSPHLLGFALAAALVVFALPSFAAPRVFVSAPSRPLVLAPREGGFSADFVVGNAGDTPLVVSRIAIRGDESDPRSPARLTVRFTDGASSSATIAPGATKAATVRWMPERDPRVKQALGHVVVTSNDEAAGEVAIGFRAAVPSALPLLSEHLSSWLVLLPFAGALVPFGLRASARVTRRTTIAVAVAELALALWAFARFVPDVGRADGNDGLQLVERAVWVRSLGVEWFVGIDGPGIVLVLLVALVALAAIYAASSIESAGYDALVLLLLSGAMGIVVAREIVLLAMSWALAASAVCLLVGGWGASSRSGPAAAKTAIFGLLATALAAIALVALVAHSDRTFLVDGAVVPRSSAIPELARVAFATKHVTVFGLPIARASWVALFLAFAIGLPMFPFHTWLPDALAEAPAPVAALMGGALVPLVPYTLLRSALVVLPEATRWGAGALVAFGVVTIVHGAFAALAQRDMRRIVAYGAMSHMGVCFVGLGALTPQGIAGALANATSQGAATALLFLVLGAIEERTGTLDIAAIRGLARRAPILAATFAVTVFAWVGLPGLAGFWGILLSVVGAFASWPALASIAIVGVVLGVAGGAWTIQRVCFGEVARERRDLSPRDVAYVVPLLVLVVLVGLWPSAILSPISGGARDAVVSVNPAGPDPVASP